MSTCKDCLFSIESSVQEHGQIGVEMLNCRRYPPQTLVIQQGLMSITPNVQPTGFCGEFKAKLKLMDA